MTPEERAERANEILVANPMVTRDDYIGILADAIRDAVADEREACAQLVERITTAIYPVNGLAQAIRNRK